MERDGAERHVRHRRMDRAGLQLLVPQQTQDLPAARRGDGGEHCVHDDSLVKTKIMSSPILALGVGSWELSGVERSALLHDPHEEQDQLENEDEHDQQFQRFTASHAGLLDREAVDVIEGIQLLADVALPLFESEPGAGEREYARGLNVARNPQCVLRAIGQFVDVDEEGVYLLRGARVAAASPASEPAGFLQLRVDALELTREQII